MDTTFDNISVDIDLADFGDLKYVVAEFEILVDSTDEMVKAKEKIYAVLKEMDIDTSIAIPAKLTYYLYHKRFDHYKALLAKGVIV